MPVTVPLSIAAGFEPHLAAEKEIMRLADLLLAELEREAGNTRSALQRVPEGHNDWKPHPNSMPLGYLASLIATLPAWVVTMVTQDELDLKSPAAAKFKPLEWRRRGELLDVLDTGLVEAREALRNATDEHLMTPWRFVIGGQVADESPRHVMIADAVFSHLAHHRGQLTVYLRLNEGSVLALYGSPADAGKVA
jgi:hypothetical protein